MEAHARAPDPLVADGDMASNWQSWKDDFITPTAQKLQKYRSNITAILHVAITFLQYCCNFLCCRGIFMKITRYIDKPKESRANSLKNRIGKVGIDAIQNITFDKPEDKVDMDILIEEYFNPPKKEVVERYQFFKLSKKQNETFEQYVNKLKEKAKTCNFNTMTESIIRDKIILDTHDKILRKLFFEAEDLDLQKIVAIYNDYDINTEKMKQVTKQNRTEQENPKWNDNKVNKHLLNKTTTQESKLPKSIHQGRTNPISQHERINPTSQQEKINPICHQGKTNSISQQKRINSISQQKRINSTSQQERINATSQQGRTNPTSQQERAVSSAFFQALFL